MSCVAQIGPVVSITLIVWEAVDELPQLSVAVQLRVTLYSCVHVPGVVTSLKVNEGVISHASVTVGVVKDGVAGHDTELGPGKVPNTGAVVSVTLIIWNAVDVLPQSSVAVHVRFTLYS
jgi:hypothetical protein